MTDTKTRLYLVIGRLGGGHPADGLVSRVFVGDGAAMDIINPQSFDDGGPEWRMRYGDPIGIRYAVAGLLESYDYLISDEITSTEAIRRLRLLRTARAALAQKEGQQ